MNAKLLILVVLMAIATSACNARIGDDTDDHMNGKSSSLILYTDFGTGCQYLKPGGADGITPRMGADGKQICKEQRKRWSLPVG